MSVFFISDPHIGHTNMALKRGFKTVEEHDECFIENYNKVVGKRHKTFILGDLTMEKNNYYWLDRLNGEKDIILGNHDLSKHTKHLFQYVNKVAACVKYKGMMLTHIPIHFSEVGRFKANIHGHVHENSIVDFLSRDGSLDPRYINVCAEVVNYTPVSLEEIELLLK